DRADDHVGPEAAAVLAEAPAFVLEAAVAGRGDELELALARVYVVVGVEHREVLPDDLVGAVAVDGGGAGAPGGDVAARVEHEDRVVADALDEAPVALLGHEARQLLLVGAAAIAQIARDLREAEHTAVGVPDRADRHLGPEV